MEAGRLIVDPPARGSWNMGVDEALLESVGASGIPCLRFYRWEEPTVSLGYFQRLEDRARHTSSRIAAIVRRSTGGGAIVHDRELTYSLTVPIRDRWAASHNQLYRSIHQSLVDWLQSLGGHDARLHPGHDLGNDEPFLCFLRRSDGDVELAGAKVVGSAQRRSRTALLQHGSILLSRSPSAPELPGISQQLSRAAASGSAAIATSPDEDSQSGEPQEFEAARFEPEAAESGSLEALAQEAQAAVIRGARAWDSRLIWHRDQLSDDETERAGFWEVERFLAQSWLGRR